MTQVYTAPSQGTDVLKMPKRVHNIIRNALELHGFVDFIPTNCPAKVFEFLEKNQETVKTEILKDGKIRISELDFHEKIKNI